MCSCEACSCLDGVDAAISAAAAARSADAEGPLVKTTPLQQLEAYNCLAAQSSAAPGGAGGDAGAGAGAGAGAAVADACPGPMLPISATTLRCTACGRSMPRDEADKVLNSAAIIYARSHNLRMKGDTATALEALLRAADELRRVMPPTALHVFRLYHAITEVRSACWFLFAVL